MDPVQTLRMVASPEQWRPRLWLYGCLLTAGLCSTLCLQALLLHSLADWRGSCSQVADGKALGVQHSTCQDREDMCGLPQQELCQQKLLPFLWFFSGKGLHASSRPVASFGCASPSPFPLRPRPIRHFRKDRGLPTSSCTKGPGYTYGWQFWGSRVQPTLQSVHPAIEDRDQQAGAAIERFFPRCPWFHVEASPQRLSVQLAHRTCRSQVLWPAAGSGPGQRKGSSHCMRDCCHTYCWPRALIGGCSTHIPAGTGSRGTCQCRNCPYSSVALGSGDPCCTCGTQLSSRGGNICYPGHSQASRYPTRQGCGSAPLPRRHRSATNTSLACSLCCSYAHVSCLCPAIPSGGPSFYGIGPFLWRRGQRWLQVAHSSWLNQRPQAVPLWIPAGTSSFCIVQDCGTHCQNGARHCPGLSLPSPACIFWAVVFCFRGLWPAGLGGSACFRPVRALKKGCVYCVIVVLVFYCVSFASSCFSEIPSSAGIVHDNSPLLSQAGIRSVAYFRTLWHSSEQEHHQLSIFEVQCHHWHHFAECAKVQNRPIASPQAVPSLLSSHTNQWFGMPAFPRPLLMVPEELGVYSRVPDLPTCPFVIQIFCLLFLSSALDHGLSLAFFSVFLVQSRALVLPSAGPCSSASWLLPSLASSFCVACALRESLRV